ncbi:ATPase, F1/V1/A1 complex, alpha/beta subunit [Tanacetum coccineum]
MNNQRGFLDSRGEVKRRKKKGHGSTGEKEQSALARNTRDEGFAGMTNDTAIHNKSDQVTHGTSSSTLTSYEVTAGTSSSTAGTDVVKNKALDKPINAKAEFKIPKASILDVHLRFGFSLYGYFVGKRVAFPVVEYYIKNAWKKFGLVRVMMNSKGFFLFNFASIERMNGVLENGLWADQELKEDMVIAIPNVEDDGEVLHTVRVEYEWEPPRCGMCMVFGHDDMLCPKQIVEKTKKQHTNHDGFQHPFFSSGTNMGSKFQVKPKKPIWKSVSRKNHASSSGKKVIQDVAGSASRCPSITPLVVRINDMESQLIEGKLVLLDDDGNLEVEEESHGEDPYDDDDFDDPGLTNAHMKFTNAFDINLRVQLR